MGACTCVHPKDGDGSGAVDFSEFSEWFVARGSQKKHQKQQEQYQKAAKKEVRATRPIDDEKFVDSLRTVFGKYDDDDSGEIDASELVEILSSLGQEVSAEEASAMVDQIDLDGSGQINFDEFLHMVRSQQGDGDDGVADGGARNKSFIDKLRQSAHQQVGNLVSQEELNWMYGVAVRMPNGTFSAVFSQEALEMAQTIGARPVSSLQAHTNQTKASPP